MSSGEVTPPITRAEMTALCQRADDDESLAEQLVDEFLEVRAQLRGSHLVLLEQLVVGRLDGAGVAEDVPHPGPDGVKAQVQSGIQVEQHAFLAQQAKQHVWSDADAV